MVKINGISKAGELYIESMDDYLKIHKMRGDVFFTLQYYEAIELIKELKEWVQEVARQPKR